jgi:hypothetical protein
MTTITTKANVTLDGLTLLYRTEGGPVDLDDAGIEWILTKFVGWSGSPAPRTQRTDRANHSGSFRAAGYRGPRSYSLEFHYTAPDPVTALSLEDRIAALCSDPAQLYPLVVSENGLTRVTMVELDGAIVITPINWYSRHVAVALAAPDPRRHDNNWQSSIGNLGSPPSGGADFTAPGLAFTPSPGADFGTPGVSSQMTLHNAGTATARPFFAVTGPLPTNWQIIDQTNGYMITCTRALGSTDSMVINCDDFPVQGFPGRSAYLNTSNNQRSAILVPYGWPRIAPAATVTYALRSTSYTAAAITSSLRSAWH